MGVLILSGEIHAGGLTDFTEDLLRRLRDCISDTFG